MSQSPEKLSLAEALSAARETRGLELGPGVLARTPEVFRQHFGDRPAVLVADTNTFAVAGQAVLDSFRQAGQRLPRAVYLYRPEALRRTQIRGRPGGSVAGPQCHPHRCRLGHASMTWPSWQPIGPAAVHGGGHGCFDGRLHCLWSSITYQSSKQTFTCPAPTAVVADLDILCAAPVAMNASGYADLLAKTSAGADWLVADALGVEPIDRKAWAIVQGGLREAVANPAGVRSGNPKPSASLPRA